MAKAGIGGGGGLRNFAGDAMGPAAGDISSVPPGDLIEDEDILNADLILRSFGISDEYCKQQQQQQQSGVSDVNQYLTNVLGHSVGVDDVPRLERSGASPANQESSARSHMFPATLQPRSIIQGPILQPRSILQRSSDGRNIMQPAEDERNGFFSGEPKVDACTDIKRNADLRANADEMETLSLLQNILAPRPQENRTRLKSSPESNIIHPSSFQNSFTASSCSFSSSTNSAFSSSSSSSSASSSGRGGVELLPQLSRESLACLGDYQLLLDSQPQQFVNADLNQSRYREEMPMFTVPSPIVLSPLFIEQKPLSSSMNTISSQHSSVSYPAPLLSPQQIDQKPPLERFWQESSPKTTPRPSPQSTPPPSAMVCDTMAAGAGKGDSRSWKRSGRSTPTGKRSRPQTPTSMSEGENSDGGYRDREPHRQERATPVETKCQPRMEDMIDEDKYIQKRKKSTFVGEKGKRDPIKGMLEELQSMIPHIGNPDEEKVSHAGLLVEASDYIRSVMRENNATKENVEALKEKIEELNKEIETSQEKLPEHGSTAIHRIISTRGKSIPDMFADHVRQRTQADWRYWVFTSIMGHFVHTFAQEVSNISVRDMDRTSIEWIQERMSLQQLRKDAFRKLAKLCSKTSIMEDPSILAEEARGFVALPDHLQTKEEIEETPPAFR